MTAGGRLTIAIGEDSRHAQVSLSDTGCGIATENLDKVFDPFFTTRQGGTGLGLPISYTIARQHGGEMEIKSHPGEGTTVAVRFPIVR
jgi:signal transduction histidine kinase